MNPSSSTNSTYPFRTKLFVLALLLFSAMIFKVAIILIVFQLLFSHGTQSKESVKPPKSEHPIFARLRRTAPQTKKPGSNAQNFIDAVSKVDPRTGSLSFSLTIGHLIAYSKRMTLKLKYDMGAASAGDDDFGLGAGWFLSLPYFTKGPEDKTIIHMGDGSQFTILPSVNASYLPIQYYDSKHVHISVVDGFTFKVKQNGETYWISSNGGVVTKYMSREGFILKFNYQNLFRHFTISNGTDVVFTMKSNKQGTGFIMETWTSMGIKRHEAILGFSAVEKLICHSCQSKNHTYTFNYVGVSGRLKRIEYPSGYVESFKYIDIGLPNIFKFWAVSIMTKDPGTNKHLLDKQTKIEIQTQHYDYYPMKGKRHDHYGTSFATFLTDGRDSLLEVDGNYSYWVEERLESTCTLRQYNKNHLLIRQEKYDCNKKSEIFEVMEHSYGCRSDLQYDKMRKTCKTIASYVKPVKTTKRYQEKGKKYMETSEFNYDEYGAKIKEVLPSTEIKLTEYGPVNAKAGEFRYPLSMTHIPRKGSHHFTVKTIFKYGKLNQHHHKGQYAVNTEKRFIYINSSGETEFKREKFTYIMADNLFYGKTETESKTATGSKTVYDVHKYKIASAGQITLTKLTHSSDFKDNKTLYKTVDNPTGLTLKEVAQDLMSTVTVYDTLARPTKKSLVGRKTDKNGKVSEIKTKYEYNVEPNNNFRKTIWPDGRIEYIRCSNKKHKLETQIMVNGKLVPTESTSYNGRWKMSSKRTHYEKDNGNMGQYQTIFYYDFLGRNVKKILPDGVTDLISFHSTTNGKLVIKRQRSTAGTLSPGTCNVAQFDKMIRKGSLYDTRFNPNYPCSPKDCLSVTITEYDGFNRVKTKQMISHNRKETQAVEKRIYDAEDKLSSKYSVDEAGNILLNSHHKYDHLHDIITHVQVMDKDQIKLIGKRELDGIGRNMKEIIGGDVTSIKYNDLGHITEKMVGQTKGLKEYDTFGRVVTEHNTVEGQPEATVHIVTAYDDSGRIKNVTVDYPVAKIHHEKHFHYEKILGHIDSYIHRTTTPRSNFSLESTKEWDTLSRVRKSREYSFEKKLYYNEKSHLSGVTFKNLFTTTEHELTMYYDEFSHRKGYKLVQTDTNEGYETENNLDKYFRVITVYFYGVKNGKRTNIGIINYNYTDLGQVNFIAYWYKSTLQMTERYEFDKVGRLEKSKCFSIPNGRWKCPPFTDGISRLPYNENSYVEHEVYKYDVFNNIVSKVTTSNEDETVRATYKYDDQDPTKLVEVQIDCENMPNQNCVHQEYKYNSQGSVTKIMMTNGSVEQELFYDGMNRLYKSKFNGITSHRYADEKGFLFYHQSDKSGNKFVVFDENNKLRSEIGEKTNGSYVYVGRNKVAFLDTKDKWKYFGLNAAGSVISTFEANGSSDHFSYTGFGCSTKNDSIGFQNLLTEDDRLLVARNGRSYAPWLGRFLQRDHLSPFGKAGIHGYAFASNSPIVMGDPSGNILEPLIGEGVVEAMLHLDAVETTTLVSEGVGAGLWGQEAEGVVYHELIPTLERPGVASLNAESQNTIAARDLTINGLWCNGGTCTHFAIGAVTREYDPLLIIDQKTFSSSYGKFVANPQSRYQGGFSLQGEKIWDAFRDYGPRGYVLGPRNLEVFNGEPILNEVQRPDFVEFTQRLEAQNAKGAILWGRKLIGVEDAETTSHSWALIKGERTFNGEWMLLDSENAGHALADFRSYWTTPRYSLAQAMASLPNEIPYRVFFREIYSFPIYPANALQPGIP